MTTLPRIRVIALRENRFSTLGDWRETPDGSCEMTVTEMVDWRYEFCVLIHELTEWAICQAAGVKTADCDRFDEVWERDIKEGFVPVEREAGFDKRCPYHRGHVWGYRMERLFCWLLGVSWKEYGAACDDLIRQYGK